MKSSVIQKEACGPSFERVNSLFEYQPETGALIQRANRGGTARKGSHAGHINPDGYRRIRVDGKQYMAHRLAWLMFYGVWPASEIDHINGKKDDNRISNLRVVSRAENEWNKPRKTCTASGYRGVTWDQQYQKWRAQIEVNGRKFYVGRFVTPEEAFAAYIAKASALRGEFLGLGVSHG
jgi:hypothetical protein